MLGAQYLIDTNSAPHHLADCESLARSRLRSNRLKILVLLEVLAASFQQLLNKLEDA